MKILQKSKTIIALTSTFLLLSGNTYSFADILAGNSGYSSPIGYSLRNNSSNVQIGNANSSTDSKSSSSSDNFTSSTLGSQNQNVYYLKSYNNSTYYSGQKTYIIPSSSVQQQENVSDIEAPSVVSQTSDVIASDNISSEEKILLDLINNERTKAGLKPLAIEQKLFEIAQIKSQDMYDNSYFSHTSPTFGKTSSLISKYGIRYYAYSENIGRTYSVYRAHSGFMNSSGHKANIMNPKFTHVGLGIVGNYYTEVFIQK